MRAGPDTLGEGKRAVTWWLLLLFFISVGPVLFITTHYICWLHSTDDYRLRQALDSLHHHDSVQVLVKLASTFTDDQARSENILNRLDQQAQKTGRLTHGCRSDPDVRAQVDRTSKFLICANLHNSELVLPSWVTQVIEGLRQLPPENIFFSIYESGSNDATAYWIQHLRLRLLLLNIRHRIISNGTLTRSDGEPRIHYLAKLRNEVLAPMLPTSTAQPEFAADYVVFLNDVHFCADDLLRLTLHKADLACGLDLWYWWKARRSLLADAAGSTAGSTQQRSGLVAAMGSGNGQQHSARKRRTRSRATGASAASGQQAAPQAQQASPQAQQAQPVAAAPEADTRPMEFYDFWVSRDINGSRFVAQPPYVQHTPSAARLQQGLPVPAYCCWNGMAVMKAAPFLQGVRFRAHQQGECRASECSLLCDDFHRLGYSDVVVDPAVRTTYRLSHAADAYTSKVPLPVLPWAQVQAACGYRSLRWRPNVAAVECCDLELGKDLVNWRKPCRHVDVMARNHTEYVAAGL